MLNKKTNNRRIWVFLAVVFLIGSVLGCLKETSGAETLLKEGLVLSKRETFFHYMGSNGVLLLLCWLWGYFLPLLPIACLSVGYKSYTIACVAMAALRSFGRKGMHFYLAGVLPHNGLLLFFMCLLCAMSARLPFYLQENKEGYRTERYLHGVRFVLFAAILLFAAFGETVLFTRAIAFLRA